MSDDNKKAMSIKNDSKINYLAREIAGSFLNRGTATEQKISATLHMLRDEAGIKSLKSLDEQHINKVVSDLQSKVAAGTLSTSAANSYISSINNIAKYIGKDELRIKASDYGLSRDISKNDGVNKANSRETTAEFKSWLDTKYQESGDIRYAALRQAVNIQEASGLRLRESLLVKLTDKDLSKDTLRIASKGDGAKNSRERTITLNAEQKQAILNAKEFLKEHNFKNLNVGTIQQGRDFANNAVKEFFKSNGVSFNYHGERHNFAHSAYSAAWQSKGYSVVCRAETGETKAEWTQRILSETGLSKAEFRQIDNEIRLAISQDLGHNRISITARYLG